MIRFRALLMALSVLLLLVLLSQPVPAVTPAGGGTHGAVTAPQPGGVPLAGSGKKIEVVNIVLDNIEGRTVSAKDGRQFDMTGSTKVIQNIQPASSMRIAELVFEDGVLVTVTIK
jgi:hypothetical protein